jgi:LL-diaminopimelate aminotransferase
MPVKKVIIEKANRLYKLPPDLLSFARIKSRQTIIKKTPTIDLARFVWPVTMDPDSLPSHDGFLPASTDQLTALKEDLADWYLAVHGAKLNPKSEIFIGGSISQLMLSLALAFIDNGDIAFVPDLGLPLYRKVVTACGGETVRYSITHKNDWQPDFERVRTPLGRVARLLFLNSPHNPTGAELSERDFGELVFMAARENIIVINDAAYQSLSGRRVVSMLAAQGARKIGVEVGSFSYLFGLPGLPFGFVAGNREIIAGLVNVQALLPNHLPSFYVELAREAIRQYPNTGLDTVRKKVSRARVGAAKFMEALDLTLVGYDGIPYIWARIAERGRAGRAARTLYSRGRVLVVPGNAFGETGQGYLRLSLTSSNDNFEAAAARLRRKRGLFSAEEKA